MRQLRLILGITLLVASLGIARAQSRPDAVEALRQILRTPDDDVARRDVGEKQCLGKLSTLGDVRRALALTEWTDPSVIGAAAEVDELNRRFLVERFQRETRELLRAGDQAMVAIIVDMIAAIADEAREKDVQPELVQPLAADLAAVIRKGDVRLRLAAARELARIDADLAVSVPALAEMVQSPDMALRRGGLDALADLVREAGIRFDRRARLPSRVRPRSEAIRAAVAVLPIAGRALDDSAPEIRRAAATTIGTTAALARRLIADPPPPDLLRSPEGKEMWRTIQADRAEVRPLLLALRDSAPTLVQILDRPDWPERLAAQQALLEIAAVRGRWIRQVAALGPKDDVLVEVFRAGLPALAGALADPFARIRCSATDVLAELGPEAAPAAPALAAALDDEDPFVRRSAVRALTKVGPIAARCATSGLARLLEDSEGAVRLAAAAALCEFTSADAPTLHAPGRPSLVARTALPPLVRSLGSAETEVKLASLLTLRRLGPEARAAVPALREALSDPSAVVRAAVASTLGGIGPLAHEAVDDLRRATKDDDADVRRAASAAILSVVNGDH